MKKIKKTEKLDEVNGGCTTDETFFRNCHNCGELYACNARNAKQVGEGCDSHSEYQCPKCNSWNDFNRF